MEIINSEHAPAAIGPYSQAVKANGFVFCSGQIALNVDGIAEQTRQILINLRNVLEASASSLEKVVKTTVYLADMDSFTQMNEVYAEFFEDNKPARATVEVRRLPKDVLIEIDCIALAA